MKISSMENSFQQRRTYLLPQSLVIQMCYILVFQRTEGQELLGHESFHWIEAKGRIEADE
jgi:hypothetical protein